jgi:inosine kinase
MKFPGKRKSKHYFPVNAIAPRSTSQVSEDDIPIPHNVYIVGIDQPLVDIEVRATEELLARCGISKGESIILDDELADQIYNEIKERKLIQGEYAGGAVGNTLHNYTVLANTRAILFGTINRDIQVGDYAFKYICGTSSLVDLSHLLPCNLPMGRALCFILPNGERSFGISKGCMNHLTRAAIPKNIIEHSSLLLITAFLLREQDAPLYDATMYTIGVAQTNAIPIVLSLGTSMLIEQDPDYWKEFISNYVNVVAMNELEAHALTGHKQTLQWCDLAFLTYGAKGLYIGAYCDTSCLRKTSDNIISKSIPEYNLYEYSRAMYKQNCNEPIAIYSHINPYQGGPKRIHTTNGAGDAALSALLHDIASNNYHRSLLPYAPKHRISYLTYSSISQICKYANRVSYEVLVQSSPRLTYGLPEREDSLEEAYWEK